MKQPDRLRVLYVARAFPPTVGGMETLAACLSEAMRAHADVTLLANRRGKKALPAFLPYALAAGTYLARKHRIDAILLADALLAPLGIALKRTTGLPVASTVCGLDMTYANRLYQAVVRRSVGRLDMTMPISKATEAEVHARAGAHTPATVIPLGINPLPEPDIDTVRAFRAQIGVDGGPLLLTAGRLIKRKGVAWFVEHVVPTLPDDVVYVIAGDGVERDAVRAAAARAGVEHRIRLLGRVPAGVLAAAYCSADVFVMPNVPVAGDIEGFGLVALEAAAAGLPVVASRLEGITEAVTHERNGLLVSPLAAGDYVATLRGLFALSAGQRRALGDNFRDYTMRTYSWDKTARRYVEALQAIVATRT